MTAGTNAKEIEMNELEALFAMVVVFSLQCIVPLIIILALSHSMNFVMAHWLRVTERDALGELVSPSAWPAADAVANDC
jgi:hypothetical protein